MSSKVFGTGSIGHGAEKIIVTWGQESIMTRGPRKRCSGRGVEKHSWRGFKKHNYGAGSSKIIVVWGQENNYLWRGVKKNNYFAGSRK